MTAVKNIVILAVLSHSHKQVLFQIYNQNKPNYGNFFTCTSPCHKCILSILQLDRLSPFLRLIAIVRMCIGKKTVFCHVVFPRNAMHYRPSKTTTSHISRNKNKCITSTLWAQRKYGFVDNGKDIKILTSLHDGCWFVGGDDLTGALHNL